MVLTMTPSVSLRMLEITLAPGPSSGSPSCFVCTNLEMQRKLCLVSQSCNGTLRRKRVLSAVMPSTVFMGRVIQGLVMAAMCGECMQSQQLHHRNWDGSDA